MNEVTVSSNQEQTEYVLDPIQTEAIELSCNLTNRLVSISGAAGSGKTTILEIIYYKLVEAGYTVALCSPTGKAAKRIYEATGIQAQTIHRLLEYTHPGEEDPATGKPLGISFPRRNRNKPLDYDVILADEYAMVNQELHSNLLAALKGGAAIRLFGDDNQLAPIEEDEKTDFNAPRPPSAFVTCLNNPKLPSVRLKTVFRQGANSGILSNLMMILKSRTPTNNDQWVNKFTDQPVSALQEYILEHYFADEPEKIIDFSALNNQIIVPQNTSWVGTAKLNFILQQIYQDQNEDFLEIPRYPTYVRGKLDESAPKTLKLFKGDKVIFKKNNADLQVFNGETGIVIEVDQEYGNVVIDFGDREQSIPPIQMITNQWGKTVEFDPRKDIDLAYVITTHKSQGSQYDHVVYIMNKSNAFMLNNRNLYTACSRAKKFVYLITDQKMFTSAVYKKN